MPEYFPIGLLGPLLWIVGTIIVGFVAGLLMQRDLSIAQAFLVGVVGTVLGGLALFFLRPYLFLVPGDGRTTYLLVSLAAGVLAAMMLLQVTGLGARTSDFRAPRPSQRYSRRYRAGAAHPTGRVPIAAAPAAERPSGALMLVGALLLAAGLALGLMAALQA